MTKISAAQYLEPMSMDTPTGRFLVSWHPPENVPEGQAHGAAGVCLADSSSLVLISHDGIHWGFPAGRPEDAETARQTLDREMWEEACVRVRDARLLGYSRGECVDGLEQGIVLVRSIWMADVDIEPWIPQFEIEHRRIVPAEEATAHVSEPNDVLTRLSYRALAEAGLS